MYTTCTTNDLEYAEKRAAASLAMATRAGPGSATQAEWFKSARGWQRLADKLASRLGMVSVEACVGKDEPAQLSEAA